MLVAPPLWTGFSPHHLRFGATVTLASSTFAALVRETVASLRSWCARVIVVNGHGGNRGPLITLGVEDGVESLSYWELVAPTRLNALFPFDLGSVGHAGEFETSEMLAAFPALVGEPGFAHEPIIERNPTFLVPDMGESGVLGDPRAATADDGRKVLDDVVAALVALLDGKREDDDLDNADADAAEAGGEMEEIVYDSVSRGRRLASPRAAAQPADGRGSSGADERRSATGSRSRSARSRSSAAGRA